MAAVRRLGVPIVYYVSPQLWAWRPGRIQTMKALVDRVLPIFPFEEAMYQAEGMDVRFVGHPLVDLAVAHESREAFAARHDLDPARPIVALLPGSRAQRAASARAGARRGRPAHRVGRRRARSSSSRARRNLPDSFLRPVSRRRRPGPHRRGTNRRCAGGERCGDHRVRNRDRADRDPRQADGGGVPAVAGDLQAGQAARACARCTAWSISWRASASSRS